MTKPTLRLCQLILLAAASLIFSSCNNTAHVPFPEDEFGFSPPVTEALQFTPAKNLVWDTVKRGDIHPSIKKLDLEALPSTTYDTGSFRPFTKPPTTVHFDWNSLHDTIFNPANLPSKPLQCKTSLLAPTVVKTMTPTVQKGKKLSIYDFGQIHGLKANFIASLFKDKNGLLWIGSDNGLYRYDGNSVQAFVTEPSKFVIVDIIEDNEGNIWFIRADGIGRIDPRKGLLSFSTKVASVRNNVNRMAKDDNGFIWTYNIVDKAVSIIDPKSMSYKNLDKTTGLSDAIAFGVATDKNKRIWISTYNAGVDIVDVAAGKIKHLGKTDGLGSDSLTVINPDKNSKVWVATINGVDVVDVKTGTITRYEQFQGLKKNYRFSLTIDDKGFVWVGSATGVELIDPGKGMFKLIGQNDGLAGPVNIALEEDNLKRMWVASTTGLTIIEQNGQTVHPLGSTVVVTMMEDDNGNLWVGTDKGIQIINRQKNVVRWLNKSNGLGHDFVQSFFKSNHKMWVSTNGGLDIIDPIRKTIEHTGKKEGLINDTIYVVFKDKSGNTWLTGPTNGIDIIDSANNTIRHTDMSKGLSDNNIVDLKQDKDGLIWLATNNGGIDVYDPVAGTVKYLNKQPGLKEVGPKLLLPDDKGRMWIGTGKGLYVADTKHKTITAISTQQGLSSNRVTSLLPYKGSVIVGTNNKISMITAPAAGETKKDGNRNWEISVVANSERLIREQTGAWSTDCITHDGQYLWGDRGISVINDIGSRSDTVSTFVTGLNVMTQPQHFINDSKLKERDTVWAKDTFYVGADAIKPTFITAKGASWDSVAGPYNQPVNLHLPYDQNYIQFQFVQAHLSRQDSTWYAYVLEGIDKKWNLTANTFTENYLNLPPGNYTFKVSSKCINRRWSIPAEFSFTISAPWYKTGWAFALFVLAGLAILRGYIVFRSRRLERENRLLEEKITLRTSQLQKSLEDLKSTQMQLIQSEKMASLGELTAGIAHEIQNPLNFVNNFSEVNTELVDEMLEEIDKGDMEEVKALANDIKENEQRINQHGKRADAIVKGMLQHSRANTGKKEPTDINALADEYFRLSYHGLRAKDKSFNAAMHINLQPGIEKINAVPQDIGRVLLNLFNNAFYSVNEKKKGLNSSFEPAVTVTTKSVGDKIEITVKDNGTGVPQPVIDKIFQPFFTTKPTGQGTGLGLSMSYDIIKAHGGELSVQTKEGEGAEFIIRLPVA